MESSSTEDSRITTQDRRSRRRKGRKSMTSKSALRSDDTSELRRRNETAPHHVPTKEYIKWRRSADKLGARGRKEMFDLLDDSFRRHFPPRHRQDGPMPSNVKDREAQKEHPPVNEAHRRNAPKRRRPSNPESYPGATLRKPRCSAPNCAYPQSLSSTPDPVRERREVQSRKTKRTTAKDSTPTGQVGPEPKSMRDLSTSQQSPNTLVFSSDAEETLGSSAPGISINLSKGEILNLLRISERLPQRNATAKHRTQSRKSDVITPSHRIAGCPTDDADD